MSLALTDLASGILTLALLVEEEKLADAPTTWTASKLGQIEIFATHVKKAAPSPLAPVPLGASEEVPKTALGRHLASLAPATQVIEQSIKDQAISHSVS